MILQSLKKLTWRSNFFGGFFARTKGSISTVLHGWGQCVVVHMDDDDNNIFRTNYHVVESPNYEVAFVMSSCLYGSEMLQANFIELCEYILMSIDNMLSYGDEEIDVNSLKYAIEDTKYYDKNFEFDVVQTANISGYKYVVKIQFC